MKRRGDGGLSGEDAALWEHVTRGVRRSSMRKYVRSQQEGAHERELSPVAESARVPAANNPSTSPIEHSRPTPVRAPHTTNLEPRRLKRLARGRDEIEAKIDLHGMRQSEAHAALRGFLFRAFQNGHRMVLVITGKGRPRTLTAESPFDLFDDRERGVLRRSVPIWLADPDLRSIVVGHTSANIKHGGDGAIYVQLRNRDKHRG